MKAISLWQPWASLVATGAKKIETRSWPTRHRGPLAIHAAKRYPKKFQALENQEPFYSALRPGGIYKYPSFSCGAVVAICKLEDILFITKKGLHAFTTKYGGLSYNPEPKLPLPTEQEFVFGDYTPGRFAWILGDVQSLPKSIPAKGNQGLWELEGVAFNGT
ncbi:MAG TPA: ASCH domain-containing protein [Bacillota bacterium]|nr:ASCH domain-containing protein [Bacillota bacterium]